MGDKSGIEWTEATWNPTTGCDRTSPGCDHCYAMTLARRLKAMGQPKYQNDGSVRTSGPGFGAHDARRRVVDPKKLVDATNDLREQHERSLPPKGNG